MLGSLEIREIHTGKMQQDNGLGSDSGKLMAETWDIMSAMVLSHFYSLVLSISYKDSVRDVGLDVILV